MKKLSYFVAVISVVYSAINGCTPDDKTTNSISSAASITTSLQGAEVVSALLQGRELVMSSSKLFVTLGELGMSVLDPTLPDQDTDIACTGGGTYKYTGTYSNGDYNVTLTFSGCREESYQFEGSYTLTGAQNNVTIELGKTAATFNIFNFNSGFTVLIAYLKSALTFTMSGSSTGADGAYSIVANGTITVFDYYSLGECVMTFLNYQLDYLLLTDASNGNETVSITANGNVGENWSSVFLKLKFTNFTVDRKKLYSGGAFYAEDTSMNGAFDVNYTPNTYCFEGKLDVVTQVPVRSDYSLDYTTEGTLIINDTTMVDYNTTGEVIITCGSDAALMYSKEQALMKKCNFYAMEQYLPPLLGPTGTTVGSTMTITLTWLGGSTSDMDLHLKYFSTQAPTSASTEAWHADWHQGKSCGGPAGISFSDAIDIDEGGSGTCDVGLDFDDVEGYGPEHITSLKLPQGYYVVSVNSFSLDNDPSATVYLTVQVGESIFGPYSGTFTDSGGEGEDSQSWFRVADVKVNVNGTVDVMYPDTSVTPWH